MDLTLLNKAFEDFTRASKSLEEYYRHLSDQVLYLTNELELKNRQLNQALMEIQRNRDLLEAVLYNLQEAVVVTDTEERILILNPEAERLFGVRAEDVKDSRLSDLDFNVETHLTDTILRVNGRKYYVIISRSSFSSNGTIQGEVILIRDITALREIEMQYERNQRLISMGEMAIKMAHEIRNPLCSIELYASMLEKELSEDRLRRLVLGITKGIRNLDNILTNMLFFAKAHKVLRMPIKIHGILYDVIEMLNPVVESKSVRFELSIQEHEIVADAELLKQVFMNIIINAIQAEPEGGTVSITSYIRDGYYVVNIRDNGPGIAEENIERIFDPFFTTKDRGTGLGLTIAARIIQAHKGMIKVKSELSKGSEFSVWLPES